MQCSLKLTLCILLGLAGFAQAAETNKPFFAIQGYTTGQPLQECPRDTYAETYDGALICKIPTTIFDKPSKIKIAILDGVIVYATLNRFDKEMPSLFAKLKSDLIAQYGRPFREEKEGSKEVLKWYQASDNSIAKVKLDGGYLTLEMVLPTNAEQTAWAKSMVSPKGDQ